MEVEKLLIYFLKNSRKALGRTEIMKYVYLFEYYYFQKYKKQYTDLIFERYKYGPNQSGVVEATKSLEAMGIINIHTYENYYGGTSYDHTLNFSVDATPYGLDEKEEDIASFIIDELGNENYRGVLDIAYSTPPMEEIIEEENTCGRPIYGRVIDMSKSKPIFKSSRQARRLARERLEAKQQCKGSDQEYYSHLLNQYQQYEDTRRRANVAER